MLTLKTILLFTLDRTSPMMNMDQIREDLKTKLSSDRFEHTVSVMYTAAALAMCYHSDVQKALLAGLLHDCTKYMSREEHIAFCERAGVPLTDIERQNQHLLHSKSGAVAAELTYDVTDIDVLNAIRHHTTGRGEMSLLEKIIFTADYIEPTRRGLKGMDEVRSLAFTDLDQCICRISRNTLDYLHKIKAPVDQRTQDTYDYYSVN